MAKKKTSTPKKEDPVLAKVPVPRKGVAKKFATTTKAYTKAELIALATGKPRLIQIWVQNLPE